MIGNFMIKKLRLYLIATLMICFFLPTFCVEAFTQDHQDQFIDFILKRSIIANHEIMSQRLQILHLYDVFEDDGKLRTRDKIWLKEMSIEYKLDNPDFSQASTWELLLQRVGVVPNSLVIAQAINESAWGTSRFALHGNNYFGQWCYSAGCGLIPANRAPDGDYELKAFPSALASVRGYMRNLNTLHLYHDFRQQRHALRTQGQIISGAKLVNSLRMYSIRRDDYVKSISDIISKYNLGQYDEPIKPIDN